MTLKNLESQRIKLNIIVRNNGFLWLFSLVIFCIFFLLFRINLVYIATFYILILICSSGWFFYHYEIFRKNFKSTIIKSLIKEGSTHVKYFPEEFIDVKYFDKSELFQKDYTNYKGEDKIIFSNNGKLRISELEVEKEVEYSNSKGASHKHTTQVFKGLFAMATFPFTFEGKTIVMPRDIFSEFYFGKYEKVELESPRFMELWSVRSTDQVGARMALSTDIMNNLLYFQEYLGHGNIRMSFIDNNVFIAIKQSKFLEPNYKKSILEQESVDEFKFELEIISNIIKTFKLKQNK